MGKLAEHAVVKARTAIYREDETVDAGTTGTVVHIYPKGAAYVVEFGAGEAAPAIVTVRPDEIEAITAPPKPATSASSGMPRQ